MQRNFKRKSAQTSPILDRIFDGCFTRDTSISIEEEDDDHDIDEEQLKTLETILHNLNMTETIPTDQKKSYFEIKVNDTEYFSHKSTTYCLLTKDNNSLFVDRLSRVIQTVKK